MLCAKYNLQSEWTFETPCMRSFLESLNLRAIRFSTKVPYRLTINELWKIKDLSMRDRLFIELRAWVELELRLSWVWVKIELILSHQKMPFLHRNVFHRLFIYLFINLLIFIIAFLWLVRVGTLLHWETILFMGTRQWRALFTYMFYEYKMIFYRKAIYWNIKLLCQSLDTRYRPFSTDLSS